MGELQSISTWWMWTGFTIFVIVMLGVDMLRLAAKAHIKSVLKKH